MKKRFLVLFFTIIVLFSTIINAFTSEKTCLFLDLDDTLIVYSPVLSRLLAQVKQDIIKEYDIFVLPETPTCFSGKTYEETMREAFEDFDEIASEKYMKLYNEEEYPMFPAIAGSVELLEKLLDNNTLFAIVSNEETKYIWWKLLQKVYTRDTYPKSLSIGSDVGKQSVRNMLVSCDDSSLNEGQRIWKRVLIKICDSDNVVIVGPDMVDGKKKPSVDMGFLALELLGLDWQNEIVHLYHVGDSEITDLPFAQNLNVDLKKNNEHSFCQGIHFKSESENDFGDIKNNIYETVYSLEGFCFQ